MHRNVSEKKRKNTYVLTKIKHDLVLYVVRTLFGGLDSDTCLALPCLALPWLTMAVVELLIAVKMLGYKVI